MDGNRERDSPDRMQGDDDEALEEFREAADILPSDWEDRDELERHEGAVETASSIEDPSQRAGYLDTLGDRLRAEPHEYEGALEQYRKATDLDPGNAVYANDVGQALLDLERYEEALEGFRKAAELDPDEAAYLNNVGLALAKLERYEEALEEFRKAAELDPDQAIYLKNIGLALYTLKRYEGALEQYRRAAEIDPGNAVYVNNVGTALYELKRYDGALEQHRKAAELDGGNAVYVNNVGRALYELKRYGEALEGFRKAAELDPDEAAYPDNVGLALYELKRYDEALEQHRKAAELDPGHAVYIDNVGRTLYELKRYDEALEQHRKAAELDGGNAVYINNVGRALYELKRHDEALEGFRKAAELDPGEAAYPSNIGRALVELKRYDEAVEGASSIEDPLQRASYLDTLGDRLRAGPHRHQDALEQYRKAAELDPGNAVHSNKIGRALLDLERYEDALEEFRKAATGSIAVSGGIGAALWGLGRPEDAIHAYSLGLNEALKGPTTEAWSSLLCELRDRLFRLEEPNRVLDLIDELLTDHPDSSLDLRLMSSSVLARLRRFSHALSQLEYAERASPNNPQIARQRANLFSMIGRNREAISELRRAIELQPWDAQGYALLGAALAEADEWEGAEIAFARGVNLGPSDDRGYVRYVWGSALLDRFWYQEAIDQFEHALMLDPQANYASHNLAFALGQQGDYDAARTRWDITRRMHEDAFAKYSLREFDPDGMEEANLCLYIGSILQEQGERTSAEEWYQRGLGLAPDNLELRAASAALYLEQRENLELDEATAVRRANQAANKIARLVHLHERTAKGSRTVVSEQQQLAELILALEDWPRAKLLLDEVQVWNPNSAGLLADMGVLFAGLEEASHAVQYFRSALIQDPSDAKIRSNLAEILLKMGRREEAEAEFRRVLRASGNHVESLVGLGEVYAAMGDAGDEEGYDRAIDHFDRAIMAAQSGGSSRLSIRKHAAVLYSRGYVGVRVYEQTSGRLDISSLKRALGDFNESSRLAKGGPEGDKAKNAARKAEERLRRFSSERINERLGPLLVCGLAALTFLVAQASFYFHYPLSDMSAQYHSALTFGALVFIVAGLYLPNLSKFKAAGIELEKRPVEQISSPTTLGIKK